MWLAYATHAHRSLVGKFAVPLVVAGAVLAVAGFTVASGRAEPKGLSTLPKSKSMNVRPMLPAASGPSTATSMTKRSPATKSLGRNGGTTSFPVHALATTDGTAITQSFDGKNFHARGVGGPIKDGDYKLTNGGAIRVRGGVIVWDAFGVVQKFKRTGIASFTDPSG